MNINSDQKHSFVGAWHQNYFWLRFKILHLQEYRNNFQDLWHKQWWIHWQKRISLDDHLHSHQSGGHTNRLSGQQIINERPQFFNFKTGKTINLILYEDKVLWAILNMMWNDCGETLFNIIYFQSDIWQCENMTIKHELYSMWFISNQRCDKDKNGKLDFQEFHEMITR